MGCCSRFHRTWWPGYNSDVIDPDKAFNFQRRLNLIKKALIFLLFLAVLAGLIYFLVTILSGGSSEACPPANETNTHNSSHSPETQPLSQATLIPTFNSDKPSGPSSTEQPTISHNNFTDIGQIETSDGESNKDESNPINGTVTLPQNATIEEIIEPSQSWCSSNNDLDCVGLSKSFKRVITFVNNSPKTTKKPVEGYVMIKNGTVWHPYCKEEWTLSMGGKLCKSFGFRQFIRLNFIDIGELHQRLGLKGVSKNGKISLIGTDQNSNATDSNLKCNVGFISCK